MVVETILTLVGAVALAKILMGGASMPEFLTEFLEDLSPEEAEELRAWLDGNQSAIDEIVAKMPAAVAE